MSLEEIEVEYEEVKPRLRNKLKKWFTLGNLEYWSMILFMLIPNIIVYIIVIYFIFKLIYPCLE